MQNLREREVNMIGKLLSLQGTGSESQEEFVDYWKVLVYDEDCRDIISPLMNVGALRQKGVTLHLLLHSERDPVVDAPAVYFVRPTSENLKRIVVDATKKLYRSFNVHFLTRIERPMLEEFAQDLVTANAATNISKIFDEYLDFIAVEPSLFTLNMKNSYVGYNSPALAEADIKDYMERVTMGLLSAIRVLGTLPIIRCAPGGAAEMCARSLYTALCENCTPRGPAYSLFTDCLVSNTSSSADYSHGQAGAVSNRPLLLIFDRASDLTPPLMHSDTYQALIDDLLDHKLNRVNVELPTKDGKKIKKTYDVNTATDLFFAKYAGASFPDTVEANESELGEVSAHESEIKSRSSAAAAAAAANAAHGDALGKDIESLPEILARKANLEAHTNILQALMKSIASREVHTYTQIEATMKLNEVAELLADGSKGSIADKARLLVLALSQMAGTGIPLATTEFKPSHGTDVTTFVLENEYEDSFVTGAVGVLRAAAEAAGKPADAPLDYAEINKVLGAIGFIKQCLSLSSPLDYMRQGGAGGAGGRSDAFSSLLSSASSHITSHASSLLAKATTFFSKFNPLLVTKIVDSLAEGRVCAENESYCCLDPRSKLMNTQHVESSVLKTLRYPDVMVFTLGGGCYNEYYNILELVKHKLSASGGGNSTTPVLQNTSINHNTTYFPRNLIYGCTELVSGEKFLSQLKQLGNKPPAAVAAGAK